MKKLILSALMLTAFNAADAQIVQGTRGYFTNSASNQTFANNAARVNASLVLSAGTSTSSTTPLRAFHFMDFPQSNFDASPTVYFGINNRDNNTRLRFVAAQGSASYFELFDKSQVENFTIVDDGNNNISLKMPKANSRVMIGTSSYTDGTDVYSLSVNGNVRANRVKVYTTWADYVFEEGYKLPTLEEVEKHITEKGHLLDMPSAKEVEVNGIDLGEMNKLLLQKIEELTLYTIEMNKQVSQLKTEVEMLRGKKQ